MMKMENKIKIGERRYKEMEDRKLEFMKKYAESGDSLYLELAQSENENMNKLAFAIMKAKLKIS